MKAAQYLIAFGVGLTIALDLDGDRRDTTLTLRAAQEAEETRWKYLLFRSASKVILVISRSVPRGMRSAQSLMKPPGF
jgi:hypothetical protein